MRERRGMIGRIKILRRRPPPRTAVDLFAGAAGGWTLGLHWAGVQVVAAVEADAERRAAYAARWGHPVLGDIRSTRSIVSSVDRTEALIADGAGSARIRRPWLVCGSPPCKGISEVNQKGKGVDDDGLFFEALRLAFELRPLWIALENVDRLRSRGLDRVLEQLEAAGYAAQTLSLGSDSAGKDHERRRIFIVASDTARGKGRPARFARPETQHAAPGGRIFHAVAVTRRNGLGHLGAQTLGCHLRAYDGVPDRVAEFARRAYGDAVDPIFPFVIARALIAWEEGRDLSLHRLWEGEP
jgi:site-specific DNA-cytosine methylase